VVACGWAIAAHASQDAAGDWVERSYAFDLRTVLSTTSLHGAARTALERIAVVPMLQDASQLASSASGGTTDHAPSAPAEGGFVTFAVHLGCLGVACREHKSKRITDLTLSGRPVVDGGRELSLLLAWSLAGARCCCARVIVNLRSYRHLCLLASPSPPFATRPLQ
jgi:hypothetical protein